MVALGTLAILVLGIALAATGPAVYKQLSSGQAGLPVQNITQAAPDVFKIPILWPQLGGLLKVDVNAWILKTADGYILVDAGVPGDEYEQAMLTSIRNVTRGGELKLIILTHGHIDHVGSLPAIVKAYPEVQVVMHEQEAPFLTGSASYGEVPSDTIAYKILRPMLPHFNTTASLPPPRVLLLSGEEGDVADAKGPTGEAATWQLPHGLIKYTHTPGHSPGLVAYLLPSSKTLLWGDTVACFPGKDGAPHKLGFPPTAFTNNNTQIRLDAQKLAALDFRTGLPSHQFDHGPPVTRAELKAFADSLAV